MSEQNIPNFFLALKERQPAFLDAVEALGQALREAGPVDGKTAQLIQLAAAAAIRSICTVRAQCREACIVEPKAIGVKSVNNIVEDPE